MNEFDKEECFKKLDLSIDTDKSVISPPIDHALDEERFQSESDYNIFIEQIASEIPLQRLVAAKRITKSCKSWGVDILCSILPYIKQLSNDKEMIIRQTTAEALGPFAQYLDIVLEREEAHNLIITDILPLITAMLCDSMEVRQRSRTSLICIASIFDAQEIETHILSIAQSMSNSNCCHDDKITALHLFGDLIGIIGSSSFKAYLLDKLLILSGDYSFRVRCTATQQYGIICKELSCDDVDKYLLSQFLLLCSDSIWSVRNVCASLLKSVSLSVSSSSQDALVSIQIKLLNDSSRWVRNTSYQNLGGFISSLSSSSQISSDLISYFTSIPHLSSVIASADCTTHCAFNFPAVALSIGGQRWNELNETYNILCKKTIKCRRSLACSVHEIAAILGRELTEKYLLSSIELFLGDVDEIRYGVVKNLWKLLSVFSYKLRIEYVSTLWMLSSEPDSNWRFRLFLSQQFCFILRNNLYQITELKQQIIPLIFQLVQDRMADVRYAAVDPIPDAINILYNKKDNLQCITSTIETLYSARTYSKRLLYIRIADACFGTINDELWNKIFYKNLINYVNDKIFNVRFALARFINKHKLNNDKYHQVIHQLRNDEEDIEIKRFFMEECDIEQWLKGKKEEELNMAAETDSSIYATSSDEDDIIDIDKRSIIIDNGSYLIKAGFEGEEEPRIIRPSLNIKRGIITNIDDMESIWYDMFYNELSVDPIQRNILLSEATLNPISNRKKMIESMFETFDTASCAIVNEAVLSFYASGLLSGVSCVIGDGITQIVPIYDGYALKHAVIRKDLGGTDVTHYLSKLLARDYPIEIIRDIKHNLNKNDCEYKLPDGTIINIENKELFKCNHLLFDPKLMEIDCVGVHQLLYESFIKCDTDSRYKIWNDQQNYWITGGVTCTNGFIKRIKKEINTLIPSHNIDKLPAFNKHCAISVFVGASILATRSSFKEKLWITSNQYDEYGTNVVHRMY